MTIIFSDCLVQPKLMVPHQQIWDFLTIIVNINMVYDTKTLVVLHQLTPDGEKRYRQFLEDEGTRILYRA